MITLSINGKSRALDVDPSTPLLWVIRDYAGLTGTKFGCGIAQCGACTVLVDGKPVRSCVTPASAALGRQIKTIEGVNDNTNEHSITGCLFAACRVALDAMRGDIWED